VRASSPPGLISSGSTLPSPALAKSAGKRSLWMSFQIPRMRWIGCSCSRA
jgi:hypothetical protein